MYRIREIIAFISIILVTVVIIVLYDNDASSKCMNVPIITESQLIRYADISDEMQKIDYSECILHNGESAAIDKEKRIIYISQNILDNTKSYDLVGNLEITLEDCSLLFAPNVFFDNLKEAMQRGEKFQLFVEKDNQFIASYYIVFTSLPVISIDGSYAYSDEEGKEVYTGEIIVWDANDPQTNCYSVKKGMLEYNERGHSTKNLLEKKSLKINLKDSRGGNRDLDLVGLGSDDDWILNAMGLDDLKLRENLISTLWNEMAVETEYNYKMSSGEYVEVVQSGVYEGVYFLQRRLDNKYLNLPHNSVALKGDKIYAQNEEMKKEAMQLMDDLEKNLNFSYLNLSNWVDTSLFINFYFGTDNNGLYYYNNICYVVEDPLEEPDIKLVLWDVDTTFGIRAGGDFKYAPEDTQNIAVRRVEYYELVNIYSELDEILSDRWVELRTTTLTEENINEKIDGFSTQLDLSGGMIREYERWGTYNETPETIDELKSYITERLIWLDEYYSVDNTH